ncbi:MAG: ATP-dependent DNA helicase [Candidatus Micrarchaeota archaeon]
MADFLFRHDAPRKFQLGLMQDIHSAIAAGNNILLHAPTGSGKTDAALSAALTYAAKTNLTVFFLTPKISQHRIALDVAMGIAKKHNAKIRAIDLVGRRHLCLMDVDEYDNESFYHFCENKRKRKKCEFYNNVRALDFANEKKMEKLVAAYGTGMSFSEAADLAAENKLCPYELLLRMAAVSNVIIGDYYHFVVPKIRDGLLSKTGKKIEDCIVIVDEAHNLSSRVRSYLSISTWSSMVYRAEKELRAFGYREDRIGDKFTDWAEEMLGKKDEVVVTKDDFDALLGEFSTGLLNNLNDAGSTYVELKAKKSAALKLATFISEWDSELQSVRILKRTPYGVRLSRKILDPSLLTGILNETYASVLMSGTLLPLEMHRDVLGLDPSRTLLREYPSPFPESNLLNVIATEATTKFNQRNPENYLKMAIEIRQLINNTPGGVALFFPSYNVMASILPLLEQHNLHVQQSGMRPRELRELIRRFSEKGGVLCGVQGGSLAEGVDFSKEEIKTVVVVGVGLEEMNAETEALIEYYEKKFLMGWEYAYLYPGTIKALQAAGRARRKETDRVAVVYFDERFRWSTYNWIFNGAKVPATNKPSVLVGKFWQEDSNYNKASEQKQ